MNLSQSSKWRRAMKACFPAIVLLGMAWAQDPANAGSSAELQRVLNKVDQAAASFRTTQASFVWDQYQKVVDETDTQKGIVYFRRAGNDIQMAADISDPTPPKYLLFTDGKVDLYQPKIDQITRYNTGKDRAVVESFLVLGFGGSGRDMLKSFDVSYIGDEKVDGIDTAKVDLVPKSQKVRNTADHIWLWIDTARGISVQQKFFSPSGDYRLSKYSDIQLNQKIPDSAFKLKTTSKTKIVSPQG